MAPDDPALVTLRLDAPEREWAACYLVDEHPTPAFAGTWALMATPT